MSTLSVDNIIEKTSGAGVKIAGHVVQVIQGTASEQNHNASNVVLINQSFTPKFSGSKFYVSFTIPNLTGECFCLFPSKSVYWDKCYTNK